MYDVEIYIINDLYVWKSIESMAGQSKHKMVHRVVTLSEWIVIWPIYIPIYSQLQFLCINLLHNLKQLDVSYLQLKGSYFQLVFDEPGIEMTLQ